VATVLGHLSERSQSAYAGSRHARGSVGWIITATTSRQIKPFGEFKPSKFPHPVRSVTGESYEV
jgi:hypothetical protein